MNGMSPPAIAPVRWGVLGAAKIALQRVVPAIQQSRHGEVVALASRDLAKARAAADASGIARAYGSYEELLADPDVDAIYTGFAGSNPLRFLKAFAEFGLKGKVAVLGNTTMTDEGILKAMGEEAVGVYTAGWYAAGLAHYSSTYGSIADGVVLLLWLFLTSLVVLFGAEVNAVSSGDSLRMVIGPAALVTSSASTSYLRVPPATSTLPSGRNAWPPHHRSSGVSISLTSLVIGFHSRVRKVPAANCFASLPDPASTSTSPVRSTTECTALISMSSGKAMVSHRPRSAMYSGRLVS